MVKALKEIAFKIACLPKADQRWILRRLSPQQVTVWNAFQGLDLLKEAGRFRTLKKHYLKAPMLSAQPTVTAAPSLPDFCSQLASKGPLYAAVVIDQGVYPWETDFLQQLDPDGLIKKCLEHQVPDLKPSVKSALFNEWEKSISFEDYLESSHG